MFYTRKEKVSRCISEGCVFNEYGIPEDIVGAVNSLLKDRERAGFRRGLDEAVLLLEKLSTR